MSGVHVFAARSQPATEYRVDLDEGASLVCRNPKNRAIRADCCGFRRCARNLTVQVYYDCTRYSCVPGKGCKKGQR